MKGMREAIEKWVDFAKSNGHLARKQKSGEPKQKVNVPRVNLPDQN